MKYQVGDLIHYNEDDPEYDTLDAAQKEALKKSKFDASPVGVWTGQDDGSELVAIAHQEELFTK